MSYTPFPIPGRASHGLLLASGAILAGKRLWEKFKERVQMRAFRNSVTMSDETSPFGAMESSSGESISLKSAAFKGELAGLLLSSTISQEYKNETDKALEIIYTFPVGYNTTLLGMDASIGGKQLHGEVVKKADAEEKYEGAIEKGDSAIMVQESSIGLYTANLGNIAPGETVIVEIHCAKLMSYDQGRIRIAVPTVIGERYGDEHGPGALAPHETARPDANASYAFHLSLTMKGDLANARLECPSHKVQIEKGEGCQVVNLEPGAVMDRDFVLLVQGLAAESHAICARDHENWMACASFCPHMDNVEDNPLGLKILVDCSGSMSGTSIDEARKGLQKILDLLTPKDSASFSRFGNDVMHSTMAMLECNPENMKRLSQDIAATEANMGGTEMEKAVLSTINAIKPRGDEPPVMLLITDGDIWQVDSLVENSKKTGHRIFVIGVGAAPAESVLMKLARETGGICEFVTPNEDMAQSIVRMFHRMRGKIAKDIRIEWGRKPIWQAELPRYIYDAETVHSFALFDAEPEHGPTLAWNAGGQNFTTKIDEIEKSGDFDLARLGRACQMRESLTNSEKLAIALKYQLVSPLTSLVLVHERADNEKLKGLPTIQQVPQMRAYGHGNYPSVGMMHFSACVGSEIPTFLRCCADSVDSIMEIPPLGGPSGSWQDELADLWLAKLLNLTSLSDFVATLKNVAALKYIRKKVEKVARETGASALAVWALLLERLLEEKGVLDRHSLRLLKPELPEEAKKEEIKAALDR